jgi:hypothetical protein
LAFDFPANPPVGTAFTPPGTSIIYHWNGVAWLRGSSGSVAAPADYVLKAGDTMTGPLTLNADPATPMVAATKQYVDAQPHLPVGGNPGEALTKDATNVTVWGGIISCGNF